MSNERLDELVRMSHIGQDERKIVLRRPQEVRTEHDRKRFRRHVVLLLKIGDSVGTNASHASQGPK